MIRSITAGATLCALLSPAAVGQTTYQMTVAGTFTANAGSGHPDISVGDTWEYRVTFDDSSVTGEGTDFLEVASILSTELRVNGSPHETLPVEFLSLIGDYDDPTYTQAAQIQAYRTTSALNRVVLNPSELAGGVPSIIGDTVTFEEFLLLNGASFVSSDFNVRGHGPGDAVRGPISTLHVIDLLNPDSDGDGLSDADETNVHGTDPFNPDTDGDGLLDGTEVDISAMGCPDPLNPDSDADGVLDGHEVATLFSDPCNPDTDADGVADGIDPTPTEPGVPGDFIEAELRALTDALRALDLNLIDAPNANAAKGRRNAMANKVNSAANAVADGDYEDAIDELQSLFAKLDGAPAPPDWMHPSGERDAIHDTLQLMVALLQQF